MSKVAITYICTGKYKRFFPAFYGSFRENFCPNDERTFVVITDDVEWVKAQSQGDILAYDTQRRFKKDEDNADYCKFRKWKDILLAEDFLETQDYAFYFNGNTVCLKPTTVDDMLHGKDEVVKTEWYSDDYFGKEPSASAFNYQEARAHYGYSYYQCCLYGGTAQRFLQCARFIESCRNYDAVFGYDRGDIVPFHDETYYNKYAASRKVADKECFHILSWTHDPNCKDIDTVIQLVPFGKDNTGDWSCYASRFVIYDKRCCWGLPENVMQWRSCK